MRTTLLASAFFLVLAAPAFAQMNQGGGMRGDQMGNFGPNGPPPMHQQNSGPTRPPMMVMDGPGMHPPPPPPPPGMMGMMEGHHFDAMAGQMIRQLANGTFIRLRRGDDELDLHCPQNQQLQSCIVGAGQLIQDMEKLTPGHASDADDTQDNEDQSGSSSSSQSEMNGGGKLAAPADSGSQDSGSSGSGSSSSSGD